MRLHTGPGYRADMAQTLNGHVILKLRGEKKSRPISKVANIESQKPGAEGWLTINLTTGTTIALSPEAVLLLEHTAQFTRAYGKAKAQRASDWNTLDAAAYRRKHGCVAEPPKARAAKAGK